MVLPVRQDWVPIDIRGARAEPVPVFRYYPISIELLSSLDVTLFMSLVAKYNRIRRDESIIKYPPSQKKLQIFNAGRHSFGSVVHVKTSCGMDEHDCFVLAFSFE